MSRINEVRNLQNDMPGWTGIVRKNLINPAGSDQPGMIFQPEKTGSAQQDQISPTEPQTGHPYR